MPKKLDIELVEQKDTSLCWASCILMVRRTLSPEARRFIPKENFDSTIKEMSLRINEHPDEGWKHQDGSGLISDLNCFSLTGKYIDSSLSWDEIKKEIDEDRPILAFYDYHVVVIAGYEHSDHVWVYDPNDEVGLKHDYELLASKWKHTIYDLSVYTQ